MTLVVKMMAAIAAAVVGAGSVYAESTPASSIRWQRLCWPTGAAPAKAKTRKGPAAPDNERKVMYEEYEDNIFE